MPSFAKMWNLFFIVMLTVFCVNCSISSYPSNITPIQPINNFKLGHLIVKAENAQKGFFSREASRDMLEDVLEKKLVDLLSKQNGEKFFHISVIVSGYALAKPGIPVILSPKSVLILDVTIFDDETQQKVFAKPKRFSIFESLSSDTIVGSGLTLTAKEQLEDLTTIASHKISKWLIHNKAIFE